MSHPNPTEPTNADLAAQASREQAAALARSEYGRAVAQGNAAQGRNRSVAFTVIAVIAILTIIMMVVVVLLLLFAVVRY